MVVDVEGHENTIISAVDFDRHRVRFLIFEHKHMTTGQLADIEQILLPYRFELKAFGRDMIAWRRFATVNVRVA